MTKPMNTAPVLVIGATGPVGRQARSFAEWASAHVSAFESPLQR
jgi:hypothetical protein